MADGATPSVSQPSREELERKLGAARKTIDVLLARAAVATKTVNPLLANVALERAVALKTRELEQERATLAEMVAQWRALLDNAPDVISRIDPNGIVRWTNGDVASHHWSEHVAPEFRTAVARALDFVFEEGKSTTYETFGPDASGDLRWLHCRCSPILEKDKIVGAVVVERDFTDAKIGAEKLAMAQAQLAQTYKLAGIGQLAAGVAHEINTPTQYVNDNLAFLQTELGAVVEVLGALQPLFENEHALDATWSAARDAIAKIDVGYLAHEVPRALDQAVDGMQRIKSIVSAMKDFSHPSNGELVPADMRALLETTSNVARNEWKLVAEMEIDVAEDLPAVPLIRDEFTQTILNLIVNAAHAIEERNERGNGIAGRIKIAVRALERDIEVRVSDNGAGIPDDVKKRIFEPFFTTKAVGKGTGQGLAIAYDVITNKHRGTIAVESEIGRGTTFVIRVPRLAGPT